MPTPSFTDALRADLLAHIADGGTMRPWSRRDGHPSYETVYRAVREDPDFAAAMEVARAIGADAIAEEALEIADAPVERGNDGRVDQGEVANRKHRTWLRLQLLARWHPKKYGDRTAIEHSGTIDLATAMRAAQARLDAAKAPPAADPIDAAGEPADDGA